LTSKKQNTDSDWQIKLKNSAFKELKSLDPRSQKKIINALKTKIKENPLIGEKMWGKFKNLYRYRVDSYRIIYEIKKTEVVILVLRIADRKESYKLPC